MSKKFQNTTADYLEWDSNILLISKLFQDQNYKFSLLIALGSFFGIRISDLLNLKWSDILNSDILNIIEKKTKKQRSIKINEHLKKHIQSCYKEIKPQSTNDYIFTSQKGSVYSVQRINVVFKEIKVNYNLKIKNFSTHSMRKTFGRQVYNNAGSNAELALVKLSELFNHSDIRTTKKYLVIFWLLFAGGVLSIALFFYLIAVGVIGYLPPVDELQNPKNKYASEIYSSDMQVLGRYFFSTENRVNTPYNEISPNLVKALVATEDVRYYSHSGIDGWALGRAVVLTGILQNKSSGGGSTITQQLAKLLWSPRAESLIERVSQKPIEWVIAVQLEQLYTKEEIIEMYLNKFDFLNNAVGIKSAATVYFSKSPSALSIEEAATLVGMCKNPSLFNPVRHNERTRQRRNVVLDQMRKADFISRAQFDSLSALPLTLHYSKVDHKLGLAAYFREYLRLVMTAKEPPSGRSRAPFSGSAPPTVPAG